MADAEQISRWLRFVLLSGLLLAGGLLVGCAASKTAAGLEDQSGPAPLADSLSSEQTLSDLRSRLMSFADRYLASVGEASDELIAQTPSLSQRQELHEARYLNCYAVVELAGGANPAAALVDLMVLTRLQQRVWERGTFFTDDHAPQGRGVIDAFDSMAENVWAIGSDYFTPAQREKLEKLIAQWLEENPERGRVASVRFDDFDNMRGGRALQSDLGGSGLFAAITEAADKADTATQLAARTKFVVERYVLLANWQAELLVSNLMLNPEVASILSGITGITESADRVSKAAASLPQDIAEQSESLGEMMEQTRSAVGEIREALEDARQLTEPLQATGDRLTTTAEAFTTTIRAADQMVKSFSKPGPNAEKQSESEDSFDLNKLQTTADHLTTLAREVQETLAAIEQLTAAQQLESRLEPLADSLDSRIDYALYRGIVLVVIAGVVFLIFSLLSRWLGQRWVDRSS